ncbi:VWA domain-containing protein [Granulicella mallensis]|uniref:VWFA-related protein n=1 Tax=Granulicella mallensis TaxID=940614 RepID=A0A7W7ZM56_9BACT|nr:VWA domain-containing protein [Granulicella mallensis]MBB5061721.1 VWFA-related protein [Granulicella mallensis]
MMRQFLLGVLLSCCLGGCAVAQSAGAQPHPGNTSSLQPVAVDVVVQDPNGHPVHGLTKENFQLLESKTPQQLRLFEEHVASAPQGRALEFGKMPPGTFTNYTPVPPHGTLNILLLDALNTPTKDLPLLRTQLQQYVKNVAPGTHIAILGLANHLTILQGFTSDPETLKDAVEHKLIPRAAILLDHPMENAVNQGMEQTATNLQEFEAEQKSLQMRLHPQYTLDAFNQLAHYLAGFPGRKNLIWFSGAFPLDLFPDPTRKNTAAGTELDSKELHETADLLTQAQVAVYPVAISAPTPGSTPSADRTAMNHLADSTGGRVFENTNGLFDTVSKIMAAGSDYYTLAYIPSNPKGQGEHRDIRVSLAGAPASQGLKLSYRQGYYADDPNQPGKAADPTRAVATATPSPAAPATNPDTASIVAAMRRGSPAPVGILFKVRVLPASTATEDTVAKGNQLDPYIPMKGPFQRFDVDFVALPNDFQFTKLSNGLYSGSIEFKAYVYDPDGKLLNAAGSLLHLELKPETYNRFMQEPLAAHLEVSSQAGREAYLRIGIRDVPSNRIGVVEFPLSSVSLLAPPVYPQPAAAPTTAPAHSAPITPSATPAPH